MAYLGHCRVEVVRDPSGYYAVVQNGATGPTYEVYMDGTVLWWHTEHGLVKPDQSGSEMSHVRYRGRLALRYQGIGK